MQYAKLREHHDCGWYPLGAKGSTSLAGAVGFSAGYGSTLSEDIDRQSMCSSQGVTMPVYSIPLGTHETAIRVALCAVQIASSIGYAVKIVEDYACQLAFSRMSMTLTPIESLWRTKMSCEERRLTASSPICAPTAAAAGFTRVMATTLLEDLQEQGLGISFGPLYSS